MSDILKGVVVGALIFTGTLTAMAQTTETPIVPQSTLKLADDPMEQPAPKPVVGQIVLQSNGTVLAGDLIGSNVYNGENEVIGDINDLIINTSGSVDGVVIGVGGFLGIGEKDVAVEMSTIAFIVPEEGNARLILNATREDLEAAESFKTTAVQKTQKRMEKVREQQQIQQLKRGVYPIAPTN